MITQQHPHAGSTRIAEPAMIATYPGRLSKKIRRSFASAMPSMTLYRGLVNAHREPAE